MAGWRLPVGHSVTHSHLCVCAFVAFFFSLLTFFLPEVREFIKDTRPKTNTTRGGRKAHRPTPKTRTIHPTVLPDR